MNLRVTGGQVAGSVAGMRTRDRRRVGMVVLLIGALLVGGAAAIGAVLADRERITGYWAGAVLDDDGPSASSR